MKGINVEMRMWDEIRMIRHVLHSITLTPKAQHTILDVVSSLRYPCSIGFQDIWNTALKGTAPKDRNNFFFQLAVHYANDLFWFPVHCVIAINVHTSLLISTTIILSLCARHNYNHLPHNYNFKTLYWGASFWQGNNWWEENGNVCIPGMVTLDERTQPLLVSITNIKTYVQCRTKLSQIAQL